MSQQDCIDATNAMLREELQCSTIESRSTVDKDCPRFILDQIKKASSDNSLERLILIDDLDYGRRGTTNVAATRFTRQAISLPFENAADARALLG